MFRGYLLVKGRVYSNTKMWKRSFWTWLNDLISIEMENVNTQLMFGSSCFFCVCVSVWGTTQTCSKAIHAFLWYFHIPEANAVVWSTMDWENQQNGLMILAGSELTVNHQSVFFLHFFGWQWGYHKVKMARESSLKEGPTDFPARHLCDSVNSSRPKGPSLRWKW